MDDTNVDELIKHAIVAGYLVRNAEGHIELTPDGRRFYGVPEGKTLLDIALETMVQEIKAEKRAGRPRS